MGEGVFLKYFRAPSRVERRLVGQCALMPEQVVPNTFGDLKTTVSKALKYCYYTSNVDTVGNKIQHCQGCFNDNVRKVIKINDDTDGVTFNLTSSLPILIGRVGTLGGFSEQC